MSNKCSKCETSNPDSLKYCGECGTQLTPAGEAKPSFTKTLETPVSELNRGTLFADRYEIIEVLGKGGMGTVYKVEDKKIGQDIALKLIKPEIASDKKTIERFRNELKTTRMISHRNVCRMFDLGDSEGKHFITMEYIPGEDLKSFIRRVGQLPSGKAISIAKQVCEGLAEAHRLGVVHRDLKSNNVMIDEEGNAHIMDFGIARSISAKGLTREGIIIGTPDYMSPEQAEAKEVDHRSDIYSLGVILYEMVTGQLPFEGDTPLSIAMMHKGEIPKEPKELNPQIQQDFNSLILNCLEKDKENRFRSAERVLEELANIEKGVPTTQKEIAEKKPITSKEITVTLPAKKIYIPALVFIVIVFVGLFLWKPWSKAKQVTISPGKPSVAILYFKNNTGDNNLHIWRTALSDSLITDLSQSKYVRVLSRDVLFGLLQQMNLLEAQEYSSADLRRIAEAGDVDYLVQGTFNKAGETFRIDFTIQETDTMNLIGSERVEGEGESSFFALVDDLTVKIKGKLNLTEQEIATDLDRALGTITTSSPEAYRLYIEGATYYSKGNIRQAITYHEKAVSIDPEFAMAYRALGSSYFLIGDADKIRQFMRKAYELKDRVSERERLRIEAEYYGIVELNAEKAIETFEKLLMIYPEDLGGTTNLALAYEFIEEWDKALELYRARHKMGGDFIQSYLNLARICCIQGLYEEARNVNLDYLNNVSESAGFRTALASIYAIERKYDLALKEIDRAIFLAPDNTDNYLIKGYIYHFQGDFVQAEKEFVRLPDAGQANRNKELAMRSLDLTRGKLMGQGAPALQQMLSLDSPLFALGGLFKNGLDCIEEKNFQKAEEIANRLKEATKKALLFKKVRYADYLMGRVELEKNNIEKAIEYFENTVSLMPHQTALETEQAFMISPLALAYYKSGQLEKSKEQYQRITSLTFGRLYSGDIYAKSFYMLGKIHEQQGDKAKAIEHYEKFLSLWKDADPGIAEVEDAKERLAGLKGFGGEMGHEIPKRTRQKVDNPTEEVEIKKTVNHLKSSD